MTDQNFSTAFSRVKELSETFQASEKTYLQPHYNETQARTDFIDKFWIALGWDVNHEREKNPYQQEVKAERGVKVSNRLKKADYAFFAAPNFRDVKFYVEAKKPSRNLDNADDYFQTIRYGWSSNTPLAVLTDFEQFRVIDCRYKPNIKTAENFALKKFSYTEYADEAKFREIYHLFSREAVISGSLEDYANSLPKRGRGAKQGRLFATGIQKPFDEDFLDKLDSYRAELAKSFKNKNPSLDGEDLTEAVTRTIDRLVFIKFLEDKLIEPETMMDKFDSWTDFVRTCKNLEGRYNGITFKPHFTDSADFKSDDNVFLDICGELTDKYVSYYFGDIPAYILGNIYERFLGKVIDSNAKIEEKPEVRKAGGVYYTPEYIVRYIVENTVGKLIKGKTPQEITTMRFADIACGSGSFLLGVYDSLLRYHTTYYNETFKVKSRTEDRQREARKANCITNADGSFTLSIGQRREILRNNVFGVDVDAQAVEVAQLSLALKLLEDATTATARAFQPKLGEKILPDMTKNIVCGNSLIDHDIDNGLFENKELKRLNPMSYEDKFPFLKGSEGFDAIVGNPPWISLSGRFANLIHTKSEINYLISRFQGNTYMPNMYEYFITQGLRIIKKDGYFGYIIPDRFGFNSQFTIARKKILTDFTIDSLVYKAPFPGITADTLIFVFKNVKPEPDTTALISEYEFNAIPTLQSEILKRENFSFEYFVNSESDRITSRMNSLISITKLEFVCDTTSGFGGKSKLIEEIRTNDKQIQTLKGDSIGRYELRKNYWFDFRRENITGRTTDVNKLGSIPKILLRKTGDTIIATFDESGIFPEQSLYFLYNNKTDMSFKYFLGLLNSRLLNFYFQAKSLTNKQSIAQVKKVDLDQLPIRAINFDDAADRAAHDKMVGLVEQMLEAKAHLQKARTDRDKTFYEDKCRNLDRQIDKTVYDLYDLTKGERDIVEGAA